MPRSRKRSYHHGDLRRALLDAALALLAAHGPHGLTLREVASKVGVTPAAMYHHFANKEALIVAVAEEGFGELLAYMERAVAAAAETPSTRLRAMGKGYVSFAIAHPAHFCVMFERFVDTDQHPSLQAVADRTFAALIDVVVEAQKAGVVRPGEAAEIALLAWSTMHGLANLWISGAFEFPPTEAFTIEHLTEAAADMLVRGIGAPTAGEATRSAPPAAASAPRPPDRSRSRAR